MKLHSIRRDGKVFTIETATEVETGFLWKKKKTIYRQFASRPFFGSGDHLRGYWTWVELPDNMLYNGHGMNSQFDAWAREYP